MLQKNFSTIFMYCLLFVIIIIGAHIIPKALIILATPFVYEPETFNETDVKVTVFQVGDLVIMRANVTDRGEAGIDKVILNLTDSNNVKKYENQEMINTTNACVDPLYSGDCFIYEKNYTLQASDPAGTWTVDVTANDTNNDKASNSTTFRVYCDYVIDSIPYTINESNKVYCIEENLEYNGTAITFSEGVQNTTLDCLGNSLKSNTTGDGVFMNGTTTKNNTVKNCNLTDYSEGFKIRDGPSNISLINNTIKGNYGILLHETTYSTLENNTIDVVYDGISFVAGSNYNEIINNTIVNADHGVYFYTIGGDNTFNHFENNTIKNNDVGILLSGYAINSTFIDNILENNQEYGIIVRGEDNNITNTSIFNNAIDYSVEYLQGKNNYFKNTNFIASRKIKFYVHDDKRKLIYENSRDFPLSGTGELNHSDLDMFIGGVNGGSNIQFCKR